MLRIERRPSAAVEDEDDGVEAMQSFLRGLAWWGGRGGRGGAPGLLKGTREGPWPRWCKSAAAGAFGDEREEEQRRGMSWVGEGRGTRGFGGVRGKVLGVSVARIRTKGGLQREAGGGRLRGARVCSLLPTGRRKTTSEEVSGLGQPATVLGRFIGAR